MACGCVDEMNEYCIYCKPNTIINTIKANRFKLIAYSVVFVILCYAVNAYVFMPIPIGIFQNIKGVNYDR